MIDALAVTTNEAWQGIDARQLHAALGLGRDFSTWIREVVERLELVEGRDFTSAQGLRSPDSGSSKAREQWATEYSLSLPAAKLIAISTRGPAAIKAREALIRIEESWNSPTAVMARAVSLAHAELQRIRSENDMLRPRAAAADRLLASNGDVPIRDAAKALRIGERDLVQALLAEHVLYRNARGRLAPYAEHVTAGRFRVRVVVIGKEQDGSDRVTVHTLVTPPGLVWLAARYPATAAGPVSPFRAAVERLLESRP